MEKRKNNKGFSLVELIVVVAIMAVLMTVLAPTLLRYVEKTRMQKDNSAISEIVNAIKIAAADEKVNTQIVAAGTTGITITANKDATTHVQSFDLSSLADVGTPAAPTALETELVGTFPNAVVLGSNTYNSPTAATLSLKIEMSGNAVKVTVANWIDPGTTTAVTKVFN